jgi:hypothetical protein
VLVHKAGVADEEFCRRMKSEARFTGVSKGDPLRLDGEVAGGIVGSAMDAAVRLIQAMDKWLTDHPEKK